MTRRQQTPRNKYLFCEPCYISCNIATNIDKTLLLSANKVCVEYKNKVTFCCARDH